MGTTTQTTPCTSQGSTIRYQPEQAFDRSRMRHLVNGTVNVLHCHHYAALMTQLALDAEQFDGPELLMKASAEAFFAPLAAYFEKHGIAGAADRIAIAEQNFAFMGLGQARFECAKGAASVTLPHSHVDEGWMKKWGPRTQPINHIGRGYIQAACAAISGLGSPHGVRVAEIQSIVCGASVSRFVASWQE